MRLTFFVRFTSWCVFTDSLFSFTLFCIGLRLFIEHLCRNNVCPFILLVGWSPHLNVKRFSFALAFSLFYLKNSLFSVVLKISTITPSLSCISWKRCLTWLCFGWEGLFICFTFTQEEEIWMSYHMIYKVNHCVLMFR